LLDDLKSRETAERVSEKLLRGLDSAFETEAQALSVTASIGISVYPDDGNDAEELVKNSDTAAYHAKECGGNTFRSYRAEMTLNAVKKRSLEARLHYAIEQKEFLLHYQPMVNLETSECTGIEALVRWQPAEGGLVPPSEFVPFAEDCGLIVQIGSWVLREACRQARAWQHAGLADLSIAVNVSAVEFRRLGFVEGVRAILAETGLEAQYLELELTEGVLMEDAQATISVLEELKTVGVRLAVDDFGTGYSSLSYLRQFPVDILKVDQSFVSQISSDPDDSRIVSAIINLGRSLDYRVVAEGIETQEQRAYLQAEHCQEGQGYLFSRPVSATQFADLLQTGIPLGG
jgi:EAL domain-containing protein (putative c-di-GMP-specific phosphodiesterase class I)